VIGGQRAEIGWRITWSRGQTAEVGGQTTEIKPQRIDAVFAQKFFGVSVDATATAGI